MSRVAWYWHRLRAMNTAEIARHIQKKLVPLKPPEQRFSWERALRPRPVSNKPTADAKRIITGNWKAFGKLPIQVNDPPRWNYDYVAGVEVPYSKTVNHRELPNGGDIKLIWELSRWYELVRLAEAGAGDKCVEWLEDWAQKNPPYQGLNWISALEAGIRLIHFSKMDMTLGGLGGLRQKILPAHVWFTWKERSFGSSANNHLIGELAGLIVATVAWPDLTTLCVPLDRLQREWESEVLAQFAPDGGNREQALNYHAFSLELCEAARAALRHAAKKISPAVEESMKLAAEFYAVAQVPGEHWDYGDSDDAAHRSTECRPEEGRWHYFADSGIARFCAGDWDLRWDLSPLGYLATAAHGHLDALHLSIWWKGMALVIDPGTGAYFADAKLRTALAGWDAHNGPHLPSQVYPKRLGPFLWSGHHTRPEWHDGRGSFRIAHGTFFRKVTQVERGWQVEDTLEPHEPFVVRWQFGPDAQISATAEHSWRLNRQDASFGIEVSGAVGKIGSAVVSPGFRQTAVAPFLELRTGTKACLLRTEFLHC